MSLAVSGNKQETNLKLGSESSKLAVGGALTMIDQGVVSLTNFLTVVAIAKFSSESVFASFILVWQFIHYLRTVQDRLLGTPISAFFFRPDQDQSSLVGSSIVHQWIFTLVSLVLVSACSAVALWGGFGQSFAGDLFVYGFALPGLLIRDHLRLISFTALKPLAALALDGLAAIGQLGGLAILIVSSRLTPGWITLALLVAGACPCAVWLSRRPVPFRFWAASIREVWSESWRYSRWLLLARMMGIASFLIIPWMVAWQLGEASTGALGACLSLVGLTNMLVTGLNNFLLPHTVQAYHIGGRRSLLRYCQFSASTFVVVLLPICAVFAIWGSDLLGLIYRDAYADFGWVVFILSLNVVCYSIAIAAANALAALELPIRNLAGEGANLLVALAAAVVLIPTYQLVGAAMAITLGSCASTVITLWIVWDAIRKTSDKLDLDSTSQEPIHV